MGVDAWNLWLSKNTHKLYGRTVILDTNVLVNNCQILNEFITDTVLIPDVILDELENLHKNKAVIEARQAISTIHKILLKKSQNILIIPVGKYRGYTDDILIDGARIIKSSFPNTILVTGDKNLNLKASSYDINVRFIEPVYKRKTSLRQKSPGCLPLIVLYFIFYFIFLERLNRESIFFSVGSLIITYLIITFVFILVKIKSRDMELPTTTLPLSIKMRAYCSYLLEPLKKIGNVNNKIINWLDQFFPKTIVSILCFFIWTMLLACLMDLYLVFPDLLGYRISYSDFPYIASLVAIALITQARSRQG